MSRPSELVLIPFPAMGHLVPAVELAKRIVARDEMLSILILIIKLPLEQIKKRIQSLQDSVAFITKQITFLELPELETPPDATLRTFINQMLLDYKPVVKRAVEDRIAGDDKYRLVGMVVDFLCCEMMDVAFELNFPSYIFYASGACFLRLLLHFQSLRDHGGADVAEMIKDPKTELEVPGFRNRVPWKALPGLFHHSKEMLDKLTNDARWYRKAKGIIVNSFAELESSVVDSLCNDEDIPTIYPVGPIIRKQEPGAAGALLEGEHNTRKMRIIRWLDDQPPASVVFLCFGSMGSFGEDQAREVANGIDRSGHRFLWSLRRSDPAGQGFGSTRDYDDVGEVLPEGFLERTGGVGKVIGWAPQVEVLCHPAIGGFVSHCGWNSTLESVMFGVPIAAWPMYAEQQTNAFVLVKELGLGVEVRMDYRWNHREKSSNVIVEAEVIEKAIRSVMDEESPVRRKAKEMGELSRKATLQGGSSYASLGRFIDDVFHNVHE